MKKILQIYVKETGGIDRKREPVTFGIPLSRGVLGAGNPIMIEDPDSGRSPVQTKPLSLWSDNSIQWLQVDAQIDLKANSQKTLQLCLVEKESSSDAPDISGIQIEENSATIHVNTGPVRFTLDARTFRPFLSVLVDGREVLEKQGSRMILNASGREYYPEVESFDWIKKGFLQSTLKVIGCWRTVGAEEKPARFLAYLYFYAGKAFARMDFTILNPKAAEHIGGLWDLGDAGSMHFDELTIKAALREVGSTENSIWIHEDSASVVFEDEPLTLRPFAGGNCQSLRIHQDSSGGENWNCSNHLNGELKISPTFCGYQIHCDNGLAGSGRRAVPVVRISNGDVSASVAFRYFWQDFPKALDMDRGTITAALFPRSPSSPYELQPGERKTHTLYLSFEREPQPLQWIFRPLLPTASPDYYAETGAVPGLVPESQDPNKPLLEMIQKAVEGPNTFFHRREIIDEYGWRNFGDLFADHESENPKKHPPLVSHYNNQYDCLCGMLMRYLMSGNSRWWILASELFRHFTDIDIYHTTEDSPWYNGGVFWHTEHYVDARTATHRCYSRLHLDKRDPDSYGGGPSLSHLYTGGLVLYYYLTGDETARDSCAQLASWAANVFNLETTLAHRFVQRTQAALHRRKKEAEPSQNEIYGVDGPGRASGNCLNALLDAYALTCSQCYLDTADRLVARCVNSEDDIDARHLLDFENRWMYVVFLQALLKYLHTREQLGMTDRNWVEAKDALLHYARWMARHERPYLDTPDELAFPTETWAAQEIRKSNILFAAAQYAAPPEAAELRNRASFFLQATISYLSRYKTSECTRPVAILMLNIGANSYLQLRQSRDDPVGPDRSVQMTGRCKRPHNSLWMLTTTSSNNLYLEMLYVRWRILTKFNTALARASSRGAKQ